jgi:hypothetical protein
MHTCIRLSAAVAAAGILCHASAAQITTPVDVTVVNTPLPVTVGNTALPIRDVDNAARKAFTATCSFEFLSELAGSPSCTLATVPSGVVLVVETVAGSFLIGTTAILRRVEFQAGAARYSLTVLPMPLSTQIGGLGANGDSTSFTVTQPLRVYVPAGTQMKAQILSGNAIFVAASFTVSGYTVSVP